MTPTKVGVILLLVQLLAPQMVSYHHSSTLDRTFFTLVGFLWGLSYFSHEGFRFAVMPISGIGYSFLFLGLGFIFVYQVVQYCKEQAGRTSTMVAGIASMCPILFLLTFPYVLSGFNGVLQFPLPTLLVVGLATMRYAGPMEPTTPWEESSNQQIDSP